MTPTLRLRAAAPACAATLLLAACSSTHHIELEPSSIQIHNRGQKANLHGRPMGSDGRPRPAQICAWSSSDPKVATVEAHGGNDALVVAAGQGRATVRCTIGQVTAEIPVSVALVEKVEVSPATLDLKVTDEPAPTPLTVRALDGEGHEVQGRPVLVRCLDENMCRGDGHSQIWPVGAGSTRAVVQVDDGQAEVQVRVVDARTAAGRPHAVQGNPMEHIADGVPGASPSK
jgi:hypothetical protein